MPTFSTSRKIFLMGSLLIITSCENFPVNKKHTAIQQLISEANTTFYFDDRIWYQDIQAEIRGDQVILTGEAFFQQPVHLLERRLKKAGYEMELVDQVSYLPLPFEDDMAYGIITDSFVMGRHKPVAVKEEGTELLYGEPVRLIRESGSYYQVQSTTGYLGYIPKSAVRCMQLGDWNHYQVGKQAVFESNQHLENGLKIFMGTRLPYLEGDQLLLADGTRFQLSSDNYRIVDPAVNPLREKLVESSKKYLGLPYVWGGRSAEGVDCSGFLMQSYALNNIYLPRDTDEMANVGRIVGLSGWTSALLPGDLLFFSGSRRLVTHIAMYLGQDKIIHSSTGQGVIIQSLNPEDPDYSESLDRRFIFAKRMFD